MHDVSPESERTESAATDPSPAPPAAAAPAPAGTPETADHVLSGRGIRKSFAVGERQLEVLHGVDIDLGRGELLAVMGSSGAGKSTLLHILGLLERPSEGRVLIGGASAWDLSTAERARLRNREIGFVFQFYHLLPELDAVENTVLPAMIAHGGGAYRRRRDEYRDRAVAALAAFGLGARLGHRPAQLSGGERQRVALARALFLDPSIVIADEPTGNLDRGTGERVLELLFAEHARRRFALLLVTHDERLAHRCQRILYMEDGTIEADSATPVPD